MTGWFRGPRPPAGAAVPARAAGGSPQARTIPCMPEQPMCALNIALPKRSVDALMLKAAAAASAPTFLSMQMQAIVPVLFAGLLIPSNFGTSIPSFALRLHHWCSSLVRLVSAPLARRRPEPRLRPQSCGLSSGLRRWLRTSVRGWHRLRRLAARRPPRRATPRRRAVHATSGRGPRVCAASLRRSLPLSIPAVRPGSMTTAHTRASGTQCGTGHPPSRRSSTQARRRAART